MQRPDSPLELVPNDRRQEASDTAPRLAGARDRSDDRSPWYVGARYVADAGAAALLRQREAASVARGHLRTLAYVARILDGRALTTLGEARALVQAHVTRDLGAAPVPSLQARLARATFACWTAARRVHAVGPRRAA